VAQRKLLLADDSITIQKVVNLTFADEGIEVITVGDGDSAMEKMMEVAPDLVLADVNMPGLNGYQVCEKIKQSEMHKGTPVILLVGSFEPFDEAEATRVGADDFLTKPFQSIRQLVNKVTELLGSAKNGENAAPVSSFADTREFVLPHSASSRAVGFGDAGMDDEMIQTNNASGFALDESSKFETREESEPQHEATTQPLSEEDLQRFSLSGSQAENTTTEETVYEISDEHVLNDQSVIQNKETLREIVMPQTTSALESDDEDLLEILFEEEEDWEEETPPATQTETSVEDTPQTESQTAAEAEKTEAGAFQNEAGETLQAPEQSEISTSIGEYQSSTLSDASTQFSPELIEAVANRVVEKLSDKAVREIAWEVVPQLADLIVKRMAEEKLRQ
jgi:DNA-binding response OmpR family regulator